MSETCAQCDAPVVARGLCKKQYTAEYYRKNREKHAEYTAEYYQRVTKQKRKGRLS